MGAERRSRTGGVHADADPGKRARRMCSSRSGARPWRATWRRGTAVALSCILAAGLVPVASFAQGSETAAAARENLRANASGTVSDGAGNSADVANGYAADGAGSAAADAGYAAADSADGGVLVVGSEVVAGGEGSADAAGAQGLQSAQNLQGSQAAAGAASSAAGDAGNASGNAAAGNASGDAAGSANAAGDADPTADPDADNPGPAPDYDGTEAAYVYDEYYGEYLLTTAKGITGDKVDGDVGYTAGAATPAQVWLTLDEETNELTVHHVDNGAVAFEVPATVDGRFITTVGGCGSSNLTSVTFPADSRVTRLSWGAFSGSQLQSIALPSSLETLNESVFQDCKKLQTVEWPKNNDMLKTIPAETFAGCSMLDDGVVASIPASVETIDYRAFAS